MTFADHALALDGLLPAGPADVVIALANLRKPAELTLLMDVTGRPRSKVLEAVAWLEEKKLVRTSWSDRRSPQGGRPAKVVELTSEGIEDVQRLLRGRELRVRDLQKLLDRAHKQAVKTA